MIRRCKDEDFEAIWTIINDGAEVYKGVIPADCWADPYLSRGKLRNEMSDGVKFWGFEIDGELVGVMGIQQVQDSTLIRHAYVRTRNQKQGIGTQLLSHLRDLAKSRVLIGTWKDAVWAIHFYEKYGFYRVDSQEKDRLLQQYWTVPPRQIETSVVLADQRWKQIGNEPYAGLPE